MTPQELKSSILQLAIQGKLVEQDSKDVPANLQGITQKATDTFECDLPDSWKTAHLESVTRSIPSKQYQILESKVCQEGKYPVISQSKAYSIGYSDESEKVFRHEGSVIIFGDHTMEVKLVQFDFIVGADGVKIFEPVYDIISAEFLFYVFLYHTNGLSKVGGYSRHYKFIKDKPIPLPPLAEQKRIVAKIEELLPLIDRYEQAWNRLEEFNKRFPLDMQKSLLQWAIQGKLVEQRPEEGTAEELYRQIQEEKKQLIKEGKIKKEKPLPEIAEDEVPFEIPKSWKWVRLGTIISISSGDGLTSKEMDENGIYPVYGGNGVNGHHNAYNIAKRTLVIGRVGYYCGSTYITEGKAWVTDNAFITTFDEDRIDMKWLKYYIDYLDPRKKASSTAQPVISGKLIYPMLVPLPPLAEQKRIVDKLEELLPLCERLK